MNDKERVRGNPARDAFRQMQNYIPSGVGFDVGQNFARATGDTPVELAANEFAKPGFVIGYIAEQPASSLGFLKFGHAGKVRIRTRAQYIKARE